MYIYFQHTFSSVIYDTDYYIYCYIKLNLLDFIRNLTL